MGRGLDHFRAERTYSIEAGPAIVAAKVAGDTTVVGPVSLSPIDFA